MPSLNQILREHSPVLLLDAASAKTQVALLGAGEPARWAARTEEAGVALFACLDDLGADIGSVRAFAFCEGPGSILGVRTAAIAIRAWIALEPRPAFAYLSLAVVARAAGRPGVRAIADARRGLWHHYAEGGPLGRAPAAELSGELVMPEGFRHWEAPPPGAAPASYDLAALFALPSIAGADLFRATEAPDAFLHEEPSYAKWTPQIHRAP